MFKTLKSKVIAGAFLMMSAVTGFAADGAPSGGGVNIDYGQMTNQLNFSQVMVGILAVAGGLIAVYAGMAGVKWVLRMVKGA